MLHLGSRARGHLETLTVISQHVSYSRFARKGRLHWKTELEQVTTHGYISSAFPLKQKLCVPNKVGEGRLPHTFRSENETRGETLLHLARAGGPLETLTVISQHVS